LNGRHGVLSMRSRLLASKRHQTAQVALAFLLARGDDIAPIPGRVTPLEENTDADCIEMSAGRIEWPNNLALLS
jgi:aryl-alcohol dehydrogenase-like predicted oxidoreductase